MSLAADDNRARDDAVLNSATRSEATTPTTFYGVSTPSWELGVATSTPRPRQPSDGVTPPSNVQPPPLPSLTSVPSGSQESLAPIERAEIVISTSSGYAVHVVAGLPNGCVKPAGHAIVRTEQRIRISVYNSTPPSGAICTAIYGRYELNIPLGSDFKAGSSYAIEVNDKTLTLNAR